MSHLPQGNSDLQYLAVVRSERGLCGETFTTNVTMERPVLEPFQLRLVIAQVLLEIRELDESSPAVRYMAFVRSLA